MRQIKSPSVIRALIQSGYTPTEDDEQVLLVEFLEQKKLKYTHIPNSTYTTSWKVKHDNTLLGVRGGFPDLAICVDDTLVFIELKRRQKKLSKISPLQTEWLEALNKCKGVKAVACYGFGEAREFIIKQLTKNKE